MENAEEQSNRPFLNAPGEMASLTRKFDWEKTSLGKPSQWPKSLETTVSILLRSKFPMFLWWGEEFIQFYNDAYRPSLGASGKHPTALGQNGADCWAEIWPVIFPLIQQVKETGEATWMEDRLIPIYRNGSLENVYWTFSYSLVLNDEGGNGGVLVTCMETTDAVLSRNKLIQLNDDFRSSIMQAPFAICVFRGINFVIEIANERMFEFWGKQAAEVMNKPLFEAIPEARDQGYESLMSDVFKTGKSFTAKEMPVQLPRRGNVETVFINFTYQPLADEKGSVTAIMATAADVSEQVAARRKIEEVVALRTSELAGANETLANANRELNRSNKYLEEFAHAASHDLKEPIRKIRFFTNQLKEQLGEQLNAAVEWPLGRIENAATRMANLIDDLLVYSHVSIRPPEMSPVDLNETLTQVLQDLDLEIEEKKATVRASLLPVVNGYSRQLQQLFQNLLSNAIKYSRADEAPLVTVTGAEAVEAGLHYRVISVADNGIGFEQQYADKIFQMFSRLHGKSEYSGTGVGLSIVKKVIENHRGFIRVESVSGSGSTFKIFLPI